MCEQPTAGLQESMVQPLLSLQASVWTQLVPLQVSIVQAFPSSQFSGVPGWQKPLLHISPVVHWFPSLQGAPFRNPVPVHTPVMHCSLVQGLPSLQGPVMLRPRQFPPTQSNTRQAVGGGQALGFSTS